MDVAVEFFSLSKSFNMPGWRVGFMVGNKELVGALARMKSYLDYGMFTPIQVAAILALESPESDQWSSDIRDMYQGRRDTLCDGLQAVGWSVTRPKATMFLWAKIPQPFDAMGSLEFSKMLINQAGVAVSPGIGFGEYGDGYVRFALIENKHRIRQACKGIKNVFKDPQAALDAHSA
jgi:alanine-synthesizing transaminase